MQPVAARQSETEPTAQPIIRVRGLVKRYGAVTAVDGVDLAVNPGEVFGILGPNGAGKTTTIEMIEGLRPPDGGSIEVAGVDVVHHPERIKHRIGVQLQKTALFEELTVRELLGLFATLYLTDASRSRIDGLLDRVSLTEKATARVSTLSGGQLQRLSLAIALVNDPDIVFLDEPTTGLDPAARRNLWDIIGSLKAEKRTVVLTTHYMEEAEALCDRVAIMDYGRVLACDAPRRLIAQLGPAATIWATLDGPALDEAALRSLPGVTSAQFVDGEVELQTEDPETALTALLQRVRQAGGQVERLTVTSATLEDVFLHYTGRRLRE
ncbi:ABC transporter ATP-binding protein [Thermomicrobiaceae bacterium CFH 74404]|uniref:ABC transporter ATP-binding protein n=1 Tax=Thermalbibacter longus TaxID=2951981 RepID=A0AA41WET8_9BACT|nr:ABC transporter ATP-binding protein [Thermalbibacter longus]MCM8749274.1 ABC transporter ATP-binding protein [Thermalbibacter longus]